MNTQPITREARSTVKDAESFDGRELDPNPAYDSFELEAHGNRFTFYPRGIDRLEALIDCIDHTHETLDAFYFLFEPDDTGARVRDAMIAAAKRGVKVRLYIDDFGSNAEKPFFRGLEEAGGTFALFQASRTVRYLIRNHQKMAISDGKRVLSGGFNISDDYFGPPEEHGWRDLGVAIEGPLVDRYIDWFACIHEWIATPGSEFRRIRRMVRDWDPGTGPVQFLMGGPTSVTSAWAVSFKRDLARAEKASVVTAYFSPPRSMRRALRKAGRRSNLRMILARSSDFQITVDAARLHYERMVRHGVKLLEYQPTKLHMKLMVVDDVSYFGSGNLDMRSTRLNLELMIRVEDKAMAEKLRSLIDALEAESRLVDDQWLEEHTGFRKWIVHFWAYFVLRFIDYNMARKLNLGATSRENTRALED